MTPLELGGELSFKYLSCSHANCNHYYTYLVVLDLIFVYSIEFPFLAYLQCSGVFHAPYHISCEAFLSTIIFYRLMANKISIKLYFLIFSFLFQINIQIAMLNGILFKLSKLSILFANPLILSNIMLIKNTSLKINLPNRNPHYSSHYIMRILNTII